MTDLDRRVKSEVTGELDSLARFNSAGALTQTSRNDIRRALRRVDRQSRAGAAVDAKEAADAHVERMRRVSLDMFREQIAGLTDDPDRADEMRAIASEADTADVEETASARNSDLVDSIREKAIERLGDDIIAELEKLGDPDSRIRRAQDAADEVMDSTRARADRIAAYESDSINTEYAEVWNFANEIGEYTWIHMDDPIVRPLHEARGGQVFQWANPPAEEPLDGHPGIPPACRCRAEPVLP